MKGLRKSLVSESGAVEGRLNLPPFPTTRFWALPSRKKVCLSHSGPFGHLDGEGEDGRYGNQGRRSGNVVLCWRRRVDRGSARHPCKRDHRRSSRARSRVDTRCARRMALSPRQHLAGGWEARSARRPAPLTLASKRQTLSLFGNTRQSAGADPSFVGLRLGEEAADERARWQESRVSDALEACTSLLGQTDRTGPTSGHDGRQGGTRMRRPLLLRRSGESAGA